MKKILPILFILFSVKTIAVEEFPVEHFFKEPLMLEYTVSINATDKLNGL